MDLHLVKKGVLMKQIAIATVLALGFMLTACGGGGGASGNVTGNWAATLTNPDGTAAFSFTTSLNQNSGSSTVNVIKLTFSTSAPCFNSPTTETGSFTLSGNFNGNVTGAFGMTISTMFPGNQNVLALQGNVNNNTISGTWTLTGAGSGCTGSGNFTLTKM
jgi:hypothetical protein